MSMHSDLKNKRHLSNKSDFKVVEKHNEHLEIDIKH